MRDALHAARRRLFGVPGRGGRLRGLNAPFRAFAGRSTERWRRGRDSNPRNACALNGFRDRPVRPLRHLSAKPWLTVIVQRARTITTDLSVDKAVAGRIFKAAVDASVNARFAPSRSWGRPGLRRPDGRDGRATSARLVTPPRSVRPLRQVPPGLAGSGNRLSRVRRESLVREGAARLSRAPQRRRQPGAGRGRNAVSRPVPLFWPLLHPISR